MKCFIVILIILFNIQIKILAQNTKIELPSNKKQEQKTLDQSETQKTLNKFNDIINFGVSTKRLWMINSIIKNNNEIFYPLITKMLDSEKNDKVYMALVKAVIKLKLKKEANKIYEKINTGNLDLKILIINALGDLQFQKAKTNLLNLLENNKNKWIIRAVINSLGKLKSNEALIKMHKLYKMQEQDDDTKIVILQALAKINHSSSKKLLKKVLKTKSNPSHIRYQAAVALGKMKEKALIEDLKLYLNDPNPKIVKAVLNSLPKSKNNYKTIMQLLRHDNSQIRYSAVEKLINNLTEKSFPVLKYMLFNDDNYKVRNIVIKALNHLGNKKTIELWNSEFKKNNSLFRHQIIKTLNYLNENEALKILEKALKNNNNKTKQLIIKKYLQINPEKGTNFIQSKIMKLDDQNNLSLKLYSISLISKKFKQNSLEPLRYYLKHPNKHVRRYAYYYLINLNQKKVFTIIFNKLKQEKNEELISYIIQLFQQKKIKSAIPLLKNHFSNFKSFDIKKKTLNAIKFLKKI